MLIEQNTENRYNFTIFLTLDEYEFLEKATNYNKRSREEVLSSIIDAGLHPLET